MVLFDPLPPVPESAGTFPVTARITSRTGGDTTSSLNCDHPSIIVPTTVTIPVGELSVRFIATITNDTTPTADSSAIITGTAPTHVSGRCSFIVQDDDAHTFEFQPIGPQRAGIAFPVQIRATDAQSRTLTGVSGPAILTASNANGAVAITTAAPLQFTGGVATARVTFPAGASAVTLQAAQGPRSALSNSFNVAALTQDFFTEQFTAPEVVDLQNTSFLFTPEAGAAMGQYYRVQRTAISALPTPTTGSITLPMSDDSTVGINTPQPVQLFGGGYTTVYVCANGHISPSPDGVRGSLTEHFANARISAFMADLKPGNVSYRILPDRLLVTWSNMMGKTPVNSTNTFQAELYYDGQIRLSYLQLNTTSAISGLSRGLGIPPDFAETDFSAYPQQVVITKQPVSLSIGQGTAAQFSVTAAGTGLTYQWRKNGIAIGSATTPTYKIPAAQVADEGSYDVVVSSSGRQETSQAASLRVIAAPQFDTHPLPRVVAEGSPLLLVASVTDSQDITYQWLKNGAVIPGATRAAYALSAVQQAHAAVYSVRAKNSVGTVTSSTASVGIMKLTNTALTQNVSKPLTLTAPVAGTGLTFRWRKDGIDLSDDITKHIVGSRTVKLTVANFADADVGAYTCLVSSGASELESGAWNVSIRHIPIVNPISPGPWIVSGDVNQLITAANDPTTFSVTGLPAGVTVSPAIGRLLGKPNAAGTFTLNITATNAAGTSPALTTTVTVQPLPSEVAGTFEGLISPAAPGATANLNGGTLKLTIAATGNITGTAAIEGSTISISGRIDSSTSAHPTLTLVNTRTVPFTWAATLQAGRLSGSLMRNSESVAAEAWQTGITGTSAWAGLYNTGITLDPGLEGNLAYPQGAGHIAFTISPTGTVTWAGKTGDGLPTTGSAKLGLSARIPYHQQLYGTAAAAGSLTGWLALTQDGSNNRLLTSLSPLKWRKPAQTAFTRSYKTGFPQHNQHLAGRQYLTASPVLTLGITSSNADLSFSEGKIGTTDMVQPVTLTNPTLAATFGANPNAVVLTIKPTTGEISGSFTFIDINPVSLTQVVKRVVPYTGLLIPGSNSAIGNFQLPELPSASPATTPTTSPTWSGRVDLVPR
jgi:hypothetical protein